MSKFELPDEVYLDAAREALTRPPSFGYYGGNDEMFVTWGILPFGQHRDSDLLQRSNYRTILADLQGHAVAGDAEQDSTDFVDDMRASCWLNGWRDHITCRVLVDAEQDLTVDNLTGTFRRAVEIASWLESDHPIFDDSDYYELESEECHAAFDDAWDSVDWDEISPNRDDEDMKDDVFRALTESEYSAWFDSDDITRTVIEWTEEFAWQDYAATYSRQIPLFA